MVHADLETLKQQNEGNLISKFLVEHDDILQKLPAYLASRLTEVIHGLSIVFVKIKIRGVPPEVLDFIFEKRHYELNTNMIRSIVAYKNSSLVKQLPTQNYTVISELGYDALTNNVHDNWDLYVSQIVLAKKNTKENTDAVLSLLERSVANQSLCKQIIEHLEFSIDNISMVCKSHIKEQTEMVKSIWEMLLMADKVAVSWRNVFAYWQEFSLTSTLLDYISINHRTLSASRCECLNDDFKREIILSALDLTPFASLLPCLRMAEFDVELEELSVDKLGAMIQKRSFDFTVENYNRLVTYAPELCPQYILLHQDSYTEKIDSIELTNAIFEALIMSDAINAALKESIIKRDSAKLMTKAAAEYLSRQNIYLDKSVFEVIWEKADSIGKKELLFNHNWILEVDDFDRCFSELGDPYDKLMRTPYRHDEFIPDTPENRELVDRLQYVQYLTSCEYEIQTQHGPKRTEKKIPVIRCRVKAKPEDTVLAATK